MFGFTSKLKNKIEEVENENKELQSELTRVQIKNAELTDMIESLQEFIKEKDNLTNLIKDREFTICQQSKIIKTLTNQLHLEKVYSVKNSIVVTLKIVNRVFTTKTYQNVNSAAKTEGVDVSWLTKKLKSGNGVAIVNGIQFVLVRV
jgi:predicted nuclease with TOPRIM domain